MLDDTILIGALTGGTAVLASWVTSRGQTRAAHLQAEITAKSQRADRRREAQRTAYLEFIESTHRMGTLYWRISETHAIRRANARSTTLEELRRLLQAEYAILRRCVRIIDLEGPDDVAAAANDLKTATDTSFTAFRALINGENGADQRFDDCYEPFWRALTHFVDTAKNVLRTL